MVLGFVIIVVGLLGDSCSIRKMMIVIISRIGMVEVMCLVIKFSMGLFCFLYVLEYWCFGIYLFGDCC